MNLFLRAILLLGVTPLCAFGQPYSVTSASVGTSGESSGGTFSVVSQSKPSAMSGGSYAVVGGIESVAVAVQTPGAPLLSIARAENTIVLSWFTVGSFALEVTDDLHPPVAWSSVDVIPTQSGNEFTAKIPMALGKKFFRLRK